MMKPLKTLGATLGAFKRDRRGNVAMIGAICALPLAIMLGVAVDLGRQNSAKWYAQDSVDGAALAAANTKLKTQPELYAVVEEYLEGNLDTRYFPDGYTFDVVLDQDKQVHVRLRANVPAHFAALVGKGQMPVDVSVVAARGSAEAVELALVLDNTGSMNQSDSGTTRITALKTAATDLVNTLKENEDADVKIGVVPYGEYVNVGESNRGAGWLIADERDEYVGEKDNGKYPNEENYCASYGPYYDYTYTEQKDGYSVTKTGRKRDCLRTETRPHPKAGQDKPKTPARTNQWRFRGCVYSRPGSSRLTDEQTGASPYYGMVEQDASPDCMTPILPLTASRSSVLSALTGMRTVVNGRDPQTYIPAGVMWGINVLSPNAPFTEGRLYGQDNRMPRKIMVIMTDGANSMRYKEESKKRYAVHEQTTAAGQLKQTNDDVVALCNYAKSKGIEIYTVILGVSNGDAQTMLRTCATKSEFFFNAANNRDLGEAFRDIALSINRIRLQH